LLALAVLGMILFYTAALVTWVPNHGFVYQWQAEGGLRVVRPLPDHAASAYLQADDQIVAIDGTPVLRFPWRWLFSPGPAQEELLDYTVAVLRRSAFDEVIERKGWVLARKGNGYLALRSQMAVRWTEKGVLQGEGLIADGRRNVWICQLGRAAIDGAFSEWVDRIVAAPLSFGDLAVTYSAPGVGELAFAWEGPLTVDGKAVNLADYQRFDNPYCRAEFGRGLYEIQHEGDSLKIDFVTSIPQR
jgi:hypothetical protein